MLMGTNYTGWMAPWSYVPATWDAWWGRDPPSRSLAGGVRGPLAPARGADLLHLLGGGVALNVLLVHDVAEVGTLADAVHDVLEHPLFAHRALVRVEQPVPERPLLTLRHPSLLGRVTSHTEVYRVARSPYSQGRPGLPKTFCGVGNQGRASSSSSPAPTVWCSAPASRIDGRAERLRPRVDADERLGDLDGIRRRALEQIVRDAPVLHNAPEDSQPPHVDAGIPGMLQRRRERVRVAGERYAGRARERLCNLFQRNRPFELDVDAFGVSGVYGDSDGGRVDFEFGEVHDLAALPHHLGLFGGPPILPDGPDQGNSIAVNGLWINIFAPILERIHPATPGTRDGLISRNDHLLDAELARERRQRNDHLDRRTVGVGDEPLVTLQRFRVNFGDDEGHVGIEPEIAAVVYNESTPRDGLPR